MSQGIFDTIIPTTTSGNQLATILNNFKDAVVSGFSGTSRPSQLDPGGYWIDTTDDADDIWYYRFYDGTQDILVFTINKATGLASISNADSLLEIAKISEDSVGPILRLIKERESGGGQTKVNDILGEIQFEGTTDAGANVLQARLKSISTNDVTSSAQGAALIFEVTALNGSSISEVMRVVNGRLGVGTTSPQNVIHAIGTGIRLEKNSDDAVGGKLIVKKTRIASSGQVQSGDSLGGVDAYSQDNLGAEVIASQIETYATQNHTNSAHGTKTVFRNKKIGATTFTDQLEIGENVKVLTDLQTPVVYFGDPSTNGSWRIRLNGTKLEIDNRAGGVWVNKDTFNP